MSSEKDEQSDEYAPPSKRLKLFNAVHRPFIEDDKSDLSMEDTTDDEYFKHLIIDSLAGRKEKEDKPKINVTSVDLSSLALTDKQVQETANNDDTNGIDSEEDSLDEGDDYFGFDDDSDDVDADGLNQFLDKWKQELTTPKSENTKTLDSKSRSSSVDEFGDDEMQNDAIRKCKEKWMGKCQNETKMDASNMAIWA